jgi:hypothetical protein
VTIPASTSRPSGRASLHHGCTTSDGQKRSRRVNEGYIERTADQPFRTFTLVIGLCRAELIMLRLMVRFHLAPSVACTLYSKSLRAKNLVPQCTRSRRGKLILRLGQSQAPGRGDVTKLESSPMWK